MQWENKEKYFWAFTLFNIIINWYTTVECLVKMSVELEGKRKAIHNSKFYIFQFDIFEMYDICNNQTKAI